MGSKEDIKKEILEDIEKMNINELYFYARDNHELLYSSRLLGVVSDSDLESSLRVPVIRQARKDYELLTRNKRQIGLQYADQIPRTDIFAYAIETGEFSYKELKRIPFDHGDTPARYVRNHRHRNLLSELREMLLNPGEYPKIGIDACTSCCSNL